MNRVSRREILSLGRAAIAFAVPSLLLPVSAIAEAGDQRDWRFCDKCWAMFWNGGQSKGACPAGGTHNAQGFLFNLHFDSGKPGNYTNIQYDWRFCRKCWAIFFDGDPHNKGRCPAGGGHAAQGFMFGLYTKPPGGHAQSDWRFCDKCWELFWNGAPNKGRCPAGGGHAAQGFVFFIKYDPGPQPGHVSPQELASQLLQTAFNNSRDKLAAVIKTQLGRGDLLAKGYTLYDINLRLGQADFQFTAPTAFRYAVKGNHMYFKSTQPSDAGSYADPAFELNFNLLMDGNIVPGPKPRVQAVVASIPSLTIKSRNVAGGAALTVIALFKTNPVGRQMIQQATNEYLRRDITDFVNAQLP
jgi:hypothetical protein